VTTNSTHVHTNPFRVYYEDTDAGGIVYHANYLKFAERGRTEALRSTGLDHQSILRDFNIILIVRHLEIDYRAPAKLDDLISVTTRVTEMGNSSFTMTQSIGRDDKELALLKVVIVAINPTGTPVRIPPQLRQIFSVETPS
jgi:acyl-CoA thioester hydrolase